MNTALKLGVVIPVGTDRHDNLLMVLDCLGEQTRLISSVVCVLDGPSVRAPSPQETMARGLQSVTVITEPKHEPGIEQPRNQGVRQLQRFRPDITHVAFLDSDILVEPTWHLELIKAYSVGDPHRIMVCPYDWLPRGHRRIMPELKNDPRWASFRRADPEAEHRADISAGLACFSGNLVWPIEDFMHCGGFWSEIHHGRCEDGELGLRAVSMDMPISFCPTARGWHLHHPVNTKLALERNARDVPKLNDRHPWVQGSGVFMVDRDGAAFDVFCSHCNNLIPTVDWWGHAESCNIPIEIPVQEA
jgi:hypothetical protein